MCNIECLMFVQGSVSAAEIEGKDVLEVGSRDVNGSARPHIEVLKPRSYLGVDIQEGWGVDKICDAAVLTQIFGEGSFDVVLSTEMLEHVPDWKSVISSMKRVLRPGGIILLTTRSEGFGYHGYPGDWWRYSVEDMHNVFADFVDLIVYSDPSEPGVFVKGRKPEEFEELDLSDYKLYSIMENRRI